MPASDGKDTTFGYISYPTFNLDEPRFPQNEFTGRFLHFLDMIDPSTLFTTDAQLEAAVDLLNRYKAGTIDQSVSDKELWEAKKLKQAIVHPDTGEKIMMPFRMSGYIPFGSGYSLAKSYMVQNHFLSMDKSVAQCLRQLCQPKCIQSCSICGFCLKEKREHTRRGATIHNDAWATSDVLCS